MRKPIFFPMLPSTRIDAAHFQTLSSGGNMKFPITVRRREGAASAVVPDPGNKQNNVLPAKGKQSTKESNLKLDPSVVNGRIQGTCPGAQMISLVAGTLTVYIFAQFGRV